MAYSKIAAVLVQATKEQQKEIEDLQGQVRKMSSK